MKKIIWTCWFQGREAAPPIVKACLDSWERKNPDWDFRCLDATSIERYIPLRRYIDLDRQSVTAASLSDILRILLLHEFGGTWVDATLFCNRALDEWLPDVMTEGFFAFAAPGPGRLLSSWFLSAEPGHYLVAGWSRRTVHYWTGRQAADEYFWFHHLFGAMCEEDLAAKEAWSRAPKISADGPHALQFDDLMYQPAAEALTALDQTTPVFKLVHDPPEDRRKPGCLLDHVLGIHAGDRILDTPVRQTGSVGAEAPPPQRFASLSVSTENLGDHIQIISGLRLLSRLGVAPERYIDRDNEIASAPGLDEEEAPVGILLNGWFKTNRMEWPPHPKLAPLIYGFHIRLFQCPELVSDEAIDFYRKHQPVGCRDAYTEDLLRSKGVEVFTSNCLSLSLPRRIDTPSTQTEVFVVSRDRRIEDYIPPTIGPYTFVSHYSGSNDFTGNMARAEELLDMYRTRAKLIVTTLLHCALPAIAMGIPVVVFYPLNDEPAHTSDRERFSTLKTLVPIHHLADVERVDWRPGAVDASDVKLRILDQFYEMAERWRTPTTPPLGPIAPSTALPRGYRASTA